MRCDDSVKVVIDLARIRSNAQAILDRTGVPIIAVVKADAYGLGAAEVVRAIADLVRAFYVFDATEAVTARIWEISRRPTIALNASWTNADDFLSHHIQPVVWTADRAAQLRSANPVLSIDTGQQRFCAPSDQAKVVMEAGDCRQVMTHASTMNQVRQLVDAASSWDRPELFLHAAGSALLDQSDAWLHAVRPGLALYRGAMRVSAQLVDVRKSNGPAGYTGFKSDHFGVIMAGYSQGLRKGPCRINGQIRRVIEVGMQSAFVETGPADCVGDSVLLLDDQLGIDESAVAAAWGSSHQEVLVRMARLGNRTWI